MAHRIEFTKDINLPSNVEQYRVRLQKQIRQLRERQQLLAEQHKQKVLMLQKRLLYGKKKIFSFDRKMNQMTLTDQLDHYKMEIQALKKAIAVQEQQSEPEKSPSSTGPLAMISDKEIKIYTDPQEELLKLTHQTMRLKKSLQQVRSKYSDNFTEYKLRQQYEKLKAQNASMTQQLRQLETLNTINHNKLATNQEVNYQQMEILTIKNEYQLLLRDKNLLQNYLKNISQEKEDVQRTEKVKVMRFNEDKINRLRSEIQQVDKNNQILQNQIHFIQKEIKQRENHQQILRAKLPF